MQHKTLNSMFLGLFLNNPGFFQRRLFGGCNEVAKRFLTNEIFFEYVYL
jgi:hypothetical protein